MKIQKGVILAAGRGTRFLPLTKSLPKELLPLAGAPVLEHIVRELAAAAVTDILIVISPEKDAVRRYFCRDFALENYLLEKGKAAELELVRGISRIANITYAVQPEATGSGSAVLCAEDFCGSAAAVICNGDDVMYTPPGAPTVSAQLAAAYETANAAIIGAGRVSLEQIHKYASCDIGEPIGDPRLYPLKNIVEKPQTPEQIKSNLAPLGRYVAPPDIFDRLRDLPLSPRGELELPQALLASKFGAAAYEFCGIRYDAGDQLGYLIAATEFALREPKTAAPFRAYLASLLKTNKKN